MNTATLQDIFIGMAIRADHKGVIRVILKSGYAIEIPASGDEWQISSTQNLLITSDDVHIKCGQIAAVYWCEKPYGTDARKLPRGK